MASRGYSNNDIDVYIIHDGTNSFEETPLDKLKFVCKVDAKNGTERSGRELNGWLLDFWWGKKEDFDFDRPFIIL